MDFLAWREGGRKGGGKGDQQLEFLSVDTRTNIIDSKVSLLRGDGPGLLGVVEPGVVDLFD